MKIPKKYIHQSGRYKGKLNQKLLQTGGAKGTFKSGDFHPVVKGLVYYKWWRSKEYWVTEKVFKKYTKQSSRWKNNNKDRCNLLSIRWHYQNIDKSTLNSSNWKKRNKEQVASYSSKRRSKSLTTLTELQETIVKHFYSYSVRISEKLKIKFEVDHIIPIAKGGLHHPSNLQVVPMSWNRSKGAKNCDTWLPHGF